MHDHSSLFHAAGFLNDFWLPDLDEDELGLDFFDVVGGDEANNLALMALYGITFINKVESELPINTVGLANVPPVAVGLGEQEHYLKV